MSRQIDNMFSQIAKKYDIMNDILSFGIHKIWKDKTVKLSEVKLNDKVLDCASGTGDLAIKFKQKVGTSGKVIASDYNNDMLNIAKEKFKKWEYDIDVLQADAQNLPFEDDSFDVCSIGFGIRNVDSPEICIKEMARVVKSGGKVVILEFGQPKGFFKYLYAIYNKTILPLMAKIIANNGFAYDYLTDTASKFPCREEFLDIMRKSEILKEVEFTTLTFGIAYIYVGTVR
ncbi:MAG: bifunctional demethylmenaquinone methyltransferase/2-methoxy-6-polyprenyl-1,4-benzoquinol methylase UbiE [bacterium]